MELISYSWMDVATERRSQVTDKSVCPYLFRRIQAALLYTDGPIIVIYITSTKHWDTISLRLRIWCVFGNKEEYFLGLHVYISHLSVRWWFREHYFDIVQL